MNRDVSQPLSTSPVLKTETGTTDRRYVIKPESNGSVNTPVRNRDTNGVVVYTRNKRLKSNANSSGKVVINDVTEGNSSGKVVIDDETKGISVIPVRNGGVEEEPSDLSGKVVINDVTEGNSGIPVLKCNSSGKVVINDETKGISVIPVRNGENVDVKEEPSGLKCNSGGKVVINDVTEGISVIPLCNGSVEEERSDLKCNSSGKVVINDETEGNTVIPVCKRLKSAANECNSGGKVVINDETKGTSVIPVCDGSVEEELSDLRCNSSGKVVINDETKGISGIPVRNGGVEEEPSDLSGKVVINEVTEGKMVEIEVKEESTLTVNCVTTVNVEPLNMSNENLEVLEGKLITCGEVHDSNGVSVLSSSMEISKKISIIGRPTTVKELFETGLLEGYPVFYNGGKRGIPLRGTVKDIGILCSCDLCKGTRVVPPCKFEIHACKTYRRASQYICLENGKSLLDVVKECRKGSLKNLEATIRSFIGPNPVKENIICQNCKRYFAATSVGKIDQICDSCIVSLRSEATPTQSIKVEAGIFEPVLDINSSETSTASDTSLKRSRGRKKKKAVEIYSRKKSLRISSAHIISGRRDQLKTPNRLSNPVLSPHSNGAATMCNSFRDKMQSKISKKLSKSIAASSFLKIGSLGVSVHSRTQWKITKKDQKLHWLVFEEGGLPDGTEVAYYSRGKKLLIGYKQGSGIFCSCCNSEVSPSQFEAHAGWASRKKPYGYIYTSNGVSLHEFAISLLKGRKSSVKDSDDLCIICADGGKLVLCDGCPRAFHKECASLSAVPLGKWYCKYCENKFQRKKFVEHNANAVAAGRVSGIDPIEQITQRCIRTVKNPEEAEVIACVLCRCYDFSKSGFGPRTVILCDQCEKEYHVGCLKKRKIADLKELPKGKWFCCVDCKRIYSALQNSLNSGEEKLSESCLGAVRMKLKEKRLDFVGVPDVRWRLLSGKITSRETRVLLAEAVSIFHDCFDPIVDSATGRDFIPSMVYGRNIRGQDFGGMYCAILTVNSIVVSAGILRIFGQDMAELPLVATRIDSQGQGYFQLLLSCIEKLLAFLNVRKFVLPAAVESMSIWTEKFGFKEIPPDQLVSYKKTCWQMITFKGTSMLEKMVPKCRIIRHEETETDAPDE